MSNPCLHCGFDPEHSNHVPGNGKYHEFVADPNTSEGPMSEEDWIKEYNEQKDNPPREGDYLRTRDGSRIRLEINLQTGQEPFVFTRAFIPTVVGQMPAWYVQGENDNSCYGWKCILLPKSRAEVARRTGLKEHIVLVKELIVVRPSAQGKSLLVEVSQW